ncbi:hypothetical protein VA7868_00424 [Vibrio aerogenes CECT 7868]|uniref:Amine oxidase domain-containing protein n=1 Tax=Vibrio aerogenes CECT 7868 TaxID=1216006 RepID=A0A1M5VKI6_9VIBR|nr:FAD-dependent oxidoreductase [Vibrio aerogenes]SHH75786.1 hypothetical protein VA7868_00424 [Vibrio aerogenes CECT 7868]
MKIAIIGSGISGLTCGYHLSRDHQVTVYEANDYIGGHTATVDVEVDGQNYAVDTGFIVCNDKTYPNFMQLMDELAVERVPTQMSFSVSNQKSGLEYNGHTLRTLFAQKRNLFRPGFYAFIYEILRFNRLAKRFYRTRLKEAESQTLGEFLRQNHFSAYFGEHYILPMGAAIWSSTIADMRALPLAFFLRFFLNHGLLDVTDRPQWYVIRGGSRTYIEPMVKHFRDQIRLNSPVISVKRFATHVEVITAETRERYDEVVFACHSDQACRMLDDASPAEQEVLPAMAYQANQVTLHTDTSLLPRTPEAWASWNYLLGADPLSGQGSPDEAERPVLTYNMNILQHIDAPVTFCVSLNSDALIDPDKVLQRMTYHHPVFNAAAISAQQRKAEISGVNRSWYCGAYWYNGFHEDGVKSALDVVRGLNELAAMHSQGAA